MRQTADRGQRSNVVVLVAAELQLFPSKPLVGAQELYVYIFVYVYVCVYAYVYVYVYVYM